jgi:CRP-like cAMP-binding protein
MVEAAIDDLTSGGHVRANTKGGRSTASFEPKTFLAKVGDGKAVSKYQNGQIIFSQGASADAVFYILKGKIKLTVVSKRGTGHSLSRSGR